MAFATLQYAMNTSDINGVRGKGNFPPVTPVPPVIASSASAGGLHDEQHTLVAE